MGMFLKTVAAGLIVALLAGGVVYFGMPAKQEGYTYAPRSASTLNNTPPPSENAIDRFIRRVKTAMRPPSIESRRQQSVALSSPRANSGAPARPYGQPAKENGVKYFRLENGELTEIDTVPRSTAVLDAVNPSASLRILSVMEQAEKMTQKDIKDRVYFDVVDYALSENLFTAAGSAMELITQPGLRDTARANIAVAFAKQGDADTAFEMIDAVEVDELRDVMRLQVIEALLPRKPVGPRPQE